MPLPIFFFYLYGDHRDLHSFPTRRSSDLGPISGEWWRAGSHDYVGDDAQRSEEHTSELQSRRDLVCRLLLEKKKLVLLFQEPEKVFLMPFPLFHSLLVSLVVLLPFALLAF